MPVIRFLRSPGGQRIAFTMHGAGPALLCPAWWVSHVERDWLDPRFRMLFETLGTHRTVVRWDRCGSGLSDRVRAQFRLEDEVEVLSAMVEHLGLERFDLFGISCGGPPSIAYAARHPERVSRLVLFDSYIDGASAAPLDLRTALTQLVRAHWGLGAKAVTDLFAPDLQPHDAQRWATEQLETATPEMAAALLELAFSMNVRDLAPSVQAPALVLHRRGDRLVCLEAARELAAALPRAALTILEGNEHAPWLGDMAPLLRALEPFLGERPSQPPAASREPNSFRRQGAVWRVAYAGVVSFVPHTKGMSDLVVLLGRAGSDVPALELQQGLGHALEDPGADAVLDERALSELRARVDDLESLIHEAERHADLGRVERLRSEREALGAELGAAIGLGGRRRKLHDPGERARKAVTARIRQALEQIRANHPPLAGHLEQMITTGRSCAYRPNEPQDWLL